MIQDPSQSGTVPVQKKRAKKWPKILLWVVIGLAIIGVIATAIVKSQGKTKELNEEVTPTANDSIVILGSRMKSADWISKPIPSSAVCRGPLTAKSPVTV